MRLLVCGGRHYADRVAAYAALDAAHAKRPITLIISGAATGADAIAVDWADDRGVPWVSVPAEWQKHGRGAGPIRNAKMLEEFKPNGVLALPGGAGTANLIQLAQAAGVPVWRPYG